MGQRGGVWRERETVEEARAEGRVGAEEAQGEDARVELLVVGEHGQAREEGLQLLQHRRRGRGRRRRWHGASQDVVGVGYCVAIRFLSSVFVMGRKRVTAPCFC